MPRLAPPTLNAAEQKAILSITAGDVRENTIFSMALGTGLRLAELVGLNLGGVYVPDGTPRVRVRIRPETAKGHPRPVPGAALHPARQPLGRGAPRCTRHRTRAR